MILCYKFTRSLGVFSAPTSIWSFFGQVLGICKDALHINSLSFALLYNYQVLGIFKGHALHCHISVGLVFDSYIQVLGIRYFQRPCTSYHCCISVGLVSLYKYQVLGIFKGHALHIIVVYQWVLSLYTSIRYWVF